MPFLPANSVHTCVTSPPYWGLRDYGTATWAGGDPGCPHWHQRGGNGTASKKQVSSAGTQGYQYTGTCGRCGAVRHDLGLGNETVPDCLGWATGQPCGGCWCCRLVAVLREVRRVLRPDGTCWLNVGDAYTSGNRNGHGTRVGYKQQTNRGMNGTNDPVRAPTPVGLKEKDLCMLPARLALALQADGWYIRSEIIWSKLNPLPESVLDRPTKAHEMVYLLTNSPRYHYDALAVQEPAATGWNGSSFTSPHDQATKPHLGQDPRHETAFRNLRSVWPLASEPSHHNAHFATMPSALVRRCLLAGCSAGGVCRACLTPYRRVVERTDQLAVSHKGSRFDVGKTGVNGNGRVQPGARYETTTRGFAPACACGPEAGVTSPTCLDPFLGSGTVALVARDLFIRAVGIELNPTYCALAASRLTQGVLALAPGS